MRFFDFDFCHAHRIAKFRVYFLWLVKICGSGGLRYILCMGEWVALVSARDALNLECRLSRCLVSREKIKSVIIGSSLTCFLKANLSQLAETQAPDYLSSTQATVRALLISNCL